MIIPCRNRTLSYSFILSWKKRKRWIVDWWQTTKTIKNVLLHCVSSGYTISNATGVFFILSTAGDASRRFLLYTSKAFGYSDYHHVFVGTGRLLTFEVILLLLHTRSLCAAVGNRIWQKLSLFKLSVGVKLPRLRNGVHSLQLYLSGYKAFCPFFILTICRLYFVCFTFFIDRCCRSIELKKTRWERMTCRKSLMKVKDQWCVLASLSIQFSNLTGL